MEIIKSVGVSCVEASADTEADPLYMGHAYMDDWAEEVGRWEKKLSAKVVNIYSGHGTYATLGLAHTDPRVRRRIFDDWLCPMVATAARIRAGFGFYCHAFPESTLQDVHAYREAEDHLYDQLARIAAIARRASLPHIGIEQMYAPHQTPWTLDGSRRLLAEVYRKARAPFYLTIDTGHQTGQLSFLKPSPREIDRLLSNSTRHGKSRQTWLGPQSALEMLQQAAADPASKPELALRIEHEISRYPHLFSTPADADTYTWLRSLGCYSPIIHLQQVVNSRSAHLPFTAEMNSRGLIQAPKVLESLLQSYLQAASSNMPPRCDNIYLTLEIFTAASESATAILSKMRESVQYWREYLPEDGLPLDKVAPSITRSKRQTM